LVVEIPDTSTTTRGQLCPDTRFPSDSRAISADFRAISADFRVISADFRAIFVVIMAGGKPGQVLLVKADNGELQGSKPGAGLELARPKQHDIPVITPH
jgi:hypothetical protein